ncbi:PAS domain-containing sensor histidine kinase [Allocoleopsis franciscana]|uniref:histidine kinase n=1 Tax=Allocoleopsis franciscana PCC 7113 TaxID=1173027 RepID=K9WES6_9CYAN|nr:PAS domain-containing sensor histidine kinase [Allocoleopsis franciscana]AFZ18708.1 PAS domain S-box [Allocoleopsis franciscana PCC 7113]
MCETELTIAPQNSNWATRVCTQAQAKETMQNIEESPPTSLLLHPESYVDLVQGLDVIIWEMDALTWKFTFVSDRAQDILGYPISQWFDQPQFWQDQLLHPEDREWCIHFCVTATQAAKDHQFEYRAIAADGRVVWLKDLVRVVCDENGCAKRLRGVMVDITQEKEAQQRTQQLLREREERSELERVQKALRQSEERYRSLVEATSPIIWDTNAEGELVTEQARWSAFTGQTYAEYQGWGWLNAIHPADRTHTAQAWREALANRTLYQVEHRVRRNDGEYRYMSARAVPVLEPDGSIREWVGVHTDITQRKQVEAARDSALCEAQAARAALQWVFMQAPAAIQVTRGSNHITETANSLYIKLTGKRDLVGKPVREAFSELEGQGFFELLDQVYATGEPFIGKEMPAVFDRNDDGKLEESFWNFVYQPLVDGEGNVYGIMTHAVEVTEQVQARQEIEKKAEELAELTRSLERSNQELDQFAYITSHDLKAPLRAISTLSEWIEEDLGDQIQDDSREHLRLLRGRVQRMTDLIDGILQYSRAGRVQQVERVDVAVLIAEVMELIAPSPDILMVVEPGMPTLKTEKIPLEQVLINLIGNAIKYAQCPHARIQVSVRDVGRYYEFAIADNGPGIAPEYHEKIWVIFQRLEARDKVEGTGIGLSVVKKIVESRGGQVWVESELGAGATFRFTWPKYFQKRVKA